MDSIYKSNPNAKIITMGDLNDGPYNKSVKKATQEALDNLQKELFVKNASFVALKK